jgi:hypothetical protein
LNGLEVVEPGGRPHGDAEAFAIRE